MPIPHPMPAPAVAKRGPSPIWSLTLILLLGAMLRFWNLDLKPVWIDELHSMVFGLGRSFREIPQGMPLPLSSWSEFFSLNPSASCSDIWKTESAEDTHPPLYFCLEHAWLSESGVSVWTLRALPAAFGVISILSVYLLGRRVFDRSTGLTAAALTALSPFAVSLSQEARHYSLLTGMVATSLLLLQRILEDAGSQRDTPWWIWAAWTVTNLIGLYTHYFFLVAVIAQLGAAVLVASRWRERPRHRATGLAWRLGLGASGVALGFLPQAHTMLVQVSRPETNWLNFDPFSWPAMLAPPYFTLSGLLNVFLGRFPAPEWPGGTLLVYALPAIFGLWLLWQAQRGLRHRWKTPAYRNGLLFLAAYTLLVILTFWGAAYLLEKDVPLYFRYNTFFVPGVLVLAGAAYSCLPKRAERHSERLRAPRIPTLAVVLLAAGLSTLLVVTGVIDKRARFHPEIAERLAAPGDTPIVVMTIANSWTRVSEGLSYAAHLTLQRRPHHDRVYFLVGGSLEDAPPDLAHTARTLGSPFELIWIGAPPESGRLDTVCTEDPTTPAHRKYGVFYCDTARPIGV